MCLEGCSEVLFPDTMRSVGCVYSLRISLERGYFQRLEAEEHTSVFVIFELMVLYPMPFLKTRSHSVLQIHKYRHTGAIKL